MKKPKIKKITIKKRHFKTFIHLNFIIGIIYAFYHYVRTPKSVDMYTRRLWAAETWIIFTLYSIFIYLFSIEIASEDGEPVLYRLFRIKRFVDIRKSKEEVKKTFDYIQQNPKKYSFDTHEGIFPVEGNLTQPGSLFKTKERFWYIPLTLTFTTLGTSEEAFEFKLIKPLKNLEIIGEFRLQKLQENKTRLFVTIYSENENILNHLALALIFITPIRTIISRQLKKELKFIKNLD